MDNFQCPSCGSRAPCVWKSRYSTRTKRVVTVVLVVAFFLLCGIASQLLTMRARHGQASPLESGIGVTAALAIWMALSLMVYRKVTRRTRICSICNAVWE